MDLIGKSLLQTTNLKVSYDETDHLPGHTYRIDHRQKGA